MKSSLSFFLLVFYAKNAAVGFDFSARSTSLQHSGSDSEETSRDMAAQLTKSNLVSLHAKLLRSQLKLRATERRWKTVVKGYKVLEDILQGNAASITEDTW
jgi:hypothetical protein